MYQQLYHSLLALRNAHTPTTPSSSKIVNGHAIRARKPCGGPGCGGVKHGSVKQCPLTIPNLSSSLVYVCVRMCVCARVALRRVYSVCVRGQLSPLNSKVLKWQGQVMTVQLLPPGRLETGASLHLTPPHSHPLSLDSPLVLSLSTSLSHSVSCCDCLWQDSWVSCCLFHVVFSLQQACVSPSNFKNIDYELLVGVYKKK